MKSLPSGAYIIRGLPGIVTKTLKPAPVRRKVTVIPGYGPLEK